MQGLGDIQPVAVLQAKIKYGEGRRVRAGDFLGLIDRTHSRHDETTAGHGAAEAGPEWGVVIEDQKRLVFREFVISFVAHSSVLSLRRLWRRRWNRPGELAGRAYCLLSSGGSARPLPVCAAIVHVQ